MSTVPATDFGKSVFKLLLVIDMQNDFVTGSLGSAEARAIVPDMADKLAKADVPVWFTMDTHKADYMNDPEARHLPVPHCVKGTEGWKIIRELEPFAKNAVCIEKPTFGSVELAMRVAAIPDLKEIEMMGVCTDICVVSNALLLKAFRPSLVIKVDSALCAGTTPENHLSALSVMRSCHIDVL
jgi:nicotinamidase-related amidase